MMHLLTAGDNYVHHADLFRLCAMLPAASVDMILCDLPYASLEVGWDKLIPAAPMWEQFKRIITPTGAIVLTAKQPFSAFLLTSNPGMFRYSWYWEKSKGANVAQTTYRPLAVIEEALVFSHAPAVFSDVPTIRYFPQMTKLEKPYKRNFKNNKRGSVGSPMRNDRLEERTYEYATPRNLLYASTDGDGRYHPTQKPLDVFEYLIRTYTRPGDLVLDPCVGSGTTALAARNTQRRFICGDKEWDYVQIARRRLAEPYSLPMFAESAS